jgi:hypothetical protein
VIRWGTRVQAYVLSLTDEFPPFSINADAGRASRRSYVLSAAGGVGFAGLLAAGIALAVIFGDFRGDRVEVEVSYADLVAGREVDTQVVVTDVLVTLPLAEDPASDEWSLLLPKEGHRLVAFTLDITNFRSSHFDIEKDDFRLRDIEGHWHRALLVVVSGRIPRYDVDDGEQATSGVIFELPAGVDPDELEFQLSRVSQDLGPIDIVYQFR